MTMEAEPTEMAKSEAICGSSVSAARTRAWLAKLASARAAMARIVCERDGAGAGDGVDSIGGGGLCTAPPDSSTMIDKTYQPNEVEGRTYAAWEDATAFPAGLAGRAVFPRRRARGRPGHALQHRDPAAERDGLAAYGARAQQHFTGHP